MSMASYEWVIPKCGIFAQILKIKQFAVLVIKTKNASKTCFEYSTDSEMYVSFALTTTYAVNVNISNPEKIL